MVRQGERRSWRDGMFSSWLWSQAWAGQGIWKCCPSPEHLHGAQGPQSTISPPLDTMRDFSD